VTAISRERHGRRQISSLIATDALASDLAEIPSPPGEKGNTAVGVALTLRRSAAALDDGVEDRAAVTGLSIAQEQPVLLSDGGRPNGIFHEVVVDLNSALFEINTQERPVGERVIDGLAKSAARQIAAAVP
jgi:hypothetical protein